MQRTLSGGVHAGPFLQWVGGKSRLLDEITVRLPPHILQSRRVDCYVEPFLGGGAVYFHLQSILRIRRAVLCDMNPDLITTYKAVRDMPREVVDLLESIRGEFHGFTDEDDRKRYFYDIRARFNEQRRGFDYDDPRDGGALRAAYMIFLNKTCFNAFFTVNKEGDCTAGYGYPGNTMIYDPDKIVSASHALKGATILCGDYRTVDEYVDGGAFVYLDPPYRPLDKSDWKGYTRDGFTDDDQVEVARFFRELDRRGAYLMLSNSDPKSVDPSDDFFDELYGGYNISRVEIMRLFNPDSSKRGVTTELIITNYR